MIWTDEDRRQVGSALLGSWPGTITGWGREAFAAYVGELEARGLAADRVLIAIRTWPAGSDFPPSAPNLAAEARRDPSRPTFEECYALMYGPRGVLRARPPYINGGYAYSFEDARRRRLAECHPVVQRFVAQQGLSRLEALQLDHETYGDHKRRELREAYERLLEATEGREVVAIALGEGRRGARRLDPLAALGLQAPAQIEQEARS